MHRVNVRGDHSRCWVQLLLLKNYEHLSENIIHSERHLASYRPAQRAPVSRYLERALHKYSIMFNCLIFASGLRPTSCEQDLICLTVAYRAKVSPGRWSEILKLHLPYTCEQDLIFLIHLILEIFQLTVPNYAN